MDTEDREYYLSKSKEYASLSRPICIAAINMTVDYSEEELETRIGPLLKLYADSFTEKRPASEPMARMDGGWPAVLFFSPKQLLLSPFLPPEIANLSPVC